MNLAISFSTKPAPIPASPVSKKKESSDRIAAFVLSALDRTLDESWPCVTATILSWALPLIQQQNLPLTDKLKAAIREAYAAAERSGDANEDLLGAWREIIEQMGMMISQD